MATYRAKAPLWVRVPRQVQVGNRYVSTGETFQSDDVPGRNWFPLDDAAKAAFVKRFGKLPDERPDHFPIAVTTRSG